MPVRAQKYKLQLCDNARAPLPDLPHALGGRDNAQPYPAYCELLEWKPELLTAETAPITPASHSETAQKNERFRFVINFSLRLLSG